MPPEPTAGSDPDACAVRCVAVGVTLARACAVRRAPCVLFTCASIPSRHSRYSRYSHASCSPACRSPAELVEHGRAPTTPRQRKHRQQRGRSHLTPSPARHRLMHAVARRPMRAARSKRARPLPLAPPIDDGAPGSSTGAAGPPPACPASADESQCSPPPHLELGGPRDGMRRPTRR